MNVNLKNVLLATLLVTMLTIGTVSAKEWKGGERKDKESQGKEWRGHGGRRRGGGKWGDCPIYGIYAGKNAKMENVPKVPQEIKDKWAEAQKTAIDLRTELGKTPVNREKALELHSKRRVLMQEISDWHFNQRLDALAARQ